VMGLSELSLYNKWLISQLVENHDGVRWQVVIPASAGMTKG